MRRPPRRSAWCTDSTRRADSAYVVTQASRAIADSEKSVRVALRVDDFQVIKTASLQQGVIVSLVPANPRTPGGGGLVWVDAETFCPIILRLYE